MRPEKDLMLKRPICLLFCLAALGSSPALADDDTVAQAREAHAKSIANMTLSILQDQKKDFSDREANMQRGILHMVDVPWMAPMSALALASSPRCRHKPPRLSAARSSSDFAD